MNVWQKKMTIKGRFFDVCFLQKMLSRPKDRSFTPPENLPGEGLKHTFIREKWRFSAFGQNASWAQIYPRNEKTDRKTGRWRIKKMVGITGLEPVTFTMSTWRSNQLSYTPLALLTPFNIMGIFAIASWKLKKNEFCRCSGKMTERRTAAAGNVFRKRGSLRESVNLFSEGDDEIPIHLISIVA